MSFLGLGGFLNGYLVFSVELCVYSVKLCETALNPISVPTVISALPREQRKMFSLFSVLSVFSVVKSSFSENQVKSV
jgi:hypothetical protein